MDYDDSQDSDITETDMDELMGITKKKSSSRHPHPEDMQEGHKESKFARKHKKDDSFQVLDNIPSSLDVS